MNGKEPNEPGSVDGSVEEVGSADEYATRLRLELRSAIGEQRTALLNNAASDAASGDLLPGLLHCYVKQVMRAEHFDVPDLANEAHQLHVAANMAASLDQENALMEKLIADVQKDIDMLDDVNALQDEQIRMLKEMTEKRKTEGDMKQKTGLEQKLKKANEQFHSYRKILNELISECFAGREDNIKDLLQDMCRAFYEGSNLYVDASKNENMVIAQLVEANIIERHPHDKTLIRLNIGF